VPHAVVPHADGAVRRACDEQAVLRHDEHVLNRRLVHLKRGERHIRVQIPHVNRAVLRAREQEVAVKGEARDGLGVTLESRQLVERRARPDVDASIIAGRDERAVHVVGAQAEHLEGVCLEEQLEAPSSLGPTT